MKEIKFRYGYTDGINWMFHVFTLAQIENGEHYEILDNEPLLRQYKLQTKDSYTGLKDKNGKEIYNGDILKNDDYYVKVVFRDGSFMIYHDFFKYSLLNQNKAKKYEVTSNKHVHPEMIGNLEENKKMNRIVEYEHHKKLVSVRSDLIGKHRLYCLCYQNCEKFKPRQSGNCIIAEELFKINMKHHIVTPVFECPEYKEKS
jgi:hypothetical protein